jgi:hypothetical protein
MAKTKILNGLSYSLADSYFSGLGYFEKGTMADWIVNLANEIGIFQLQIDIINKEILPKEFKIYPLLAHLDFLNHVILKTLDSNKLSVDFIKEAKFNLVVTSERYIHCSHYTIGENKRMYTSKNVVTKSYTIFNVLNNNNY